MSHKTTISWAGAALMFIATLQPALATNLLINPDAETGDTRGWVDPDNAWGAAAEITPHGGTKFFWPARLQIPYTEMHQDVSVADQAAAIDAGARYLHLSGWLANYDQYPHDQATLAVQALDQNGSQTLYLFHSHRNPVWTFYQLDSRIPAGTRTLRVILIAQRFVGSDNDAYFDDLSLEVDASAPAYTVTVTAQAGQAEVAVGSTLQLAAATTGGSDSQYTWSSSFQAIATVDANGLVSATQAGRFTIRAEGNTTHTSGYLDVVAYVANSAIITAPASGVEWVAGTTNQITWEAKGSIPTASIDYRYGASDWTPIATGVDPNALHFAWVLPATTAALNQCQVRLSWSGGEALSPMFTIKPVLQIPITLDVHMYAGLTISGPIGQQVAIQYATRVDPQNWQALQTLTLTNSPLIWFDLASPSDPTRFYRAVAAP